MQGSRRVLVICRHNAGAGPRAREAVDIALAFGAFDQAVTLLFADDGVWNLVPGQSGETTRSMERLLGALPDYGIQPLHADARALAERGIGQDRMVPGCTLLDAAGMAALVDANEIGRAHV